MTNTKPEHDELLAMNYCDREYKMDRPLSQYVKEAFLAGITHARSRPKLYIKKNGAHTRALGFVCKQCEAETDVTDLQIEFVEASSRPELAGVADCICVGEVDPKCAYHPQPRAQTSDGELQAIINERDKAIHTLRVTIGEQREEIAKLKARMVLTTSETPRIKELQDCVIYHEHVNCDDVAYLLAIIARITSSRGNG